MVQGTLRGQAVSMTVTDLFKNDHASLVENEGRRVCGLVESVPAKSIEIRHCIVGIGHQHDIRGKLGLSFKKLLSMLIESCRRSGIDEKNPRLLCLEVGGVVDEVMNLLYTVGALITWKTAQHHQNEAVSPFFLRHLHCFARRGG